MKKTSATKKTAAPKATEKMIAKRSAAGPLGKTSGKSRTGWFMNYFKSHKGKIPTDDKILADAVKEFGAEHVGPPTVFTPTQMRGWFNTFCRRSERGLTPKDSITETVKAGKGGAGKEA